MTTILFLLAVIAVAAALCVWLCTDSDEIGPIILGLIAVVFATFAIVRLAENHDASACKAKGGRMVGTGQYQTTYVMSGNVLVPITSEITTCRVPS